MADLNTKTFGQLVEGQATAVQASATGLVDFSVGAINRAISEAVSGVALWLQALVLRVLAVTRASSSTGTDLDSFVADFGDVGSAGSTPAFARLAATFATGQVTFSRFTASGDAIVPFGITVETADGAQRYAVSIDATNPAYNAVIGGYVMADTIASITVPVAAVVGGAGGNAVAGAVSVITGALAGVDTVTNAAGFSNGIDAESDDAMRIRFRDFIQSLREGNATACRYAVTSLQQGVTCKIVENIDHAGVARTGYFYAVVDDGSGAPPASLLTAAALAIDEVRAVTSEFGVFAPTVITANVAMTLTLIAGGNAVEAAAAVKAAVKAYINARAVGEILAWSRVHQVAYDAYPDITDVTGMTVNGGTADLAITANQVVKAGTITVA